MSGYSPQTRSFKLKRLQLLAFGFKNFCLIAKDQASLPHDGLLKKTRHHALNPKFLPETMNNPLIQNEFLIKPIFNYMGTDQGVGRPAFEENSFQLTDRKRLLSNQIVFGNGSYNKSPTLLRAYQNYEPQNLPM